MVNCITCLQLCNVDLGQLCKICTKKNFRLTAEIKDDVSFVTSEIITRQFKNIHLVSGGVFQMIVEKMIKVISTASSQ